MIDDHVKPVRHLCLLFISCSILSFFYSIVKNAYNGDFLGVEVTLPFQILVFNLICTILPFILVWKYYKRLKRKDDKKKISIPLDFFFFFLIIIMIWNSIVTVLFGVGIMGAPAYEAPGTIKPLIQVMNRFNYMYGVFIYILASPKSDKKQLMLIGLLLILAYLRAGLGVFMYLGMLMYIKYFEEIRSFVKRKIIILLPLALFFPILVTSLYSLRSVLRNESSDEKRVDPITGVLIGRLSSYSDSALILQEAPFFFLGAQQLDNFYFQKQALSVFSQSFLPAHRPEIMLYKFFYEDSDANVAYMAGTQGNLYISLMKSVPTFLLNLFTIIIYILLTFAIFRLLRFKFADELAFVLLLYVIMSGVSNEYAFLIFSIAVFVILFLLVNFIRTKKNS